MTQKQIDIAHALTLSIGELLAYIVEIYGKDIYLQNRKLVGLISDIIQDEDTKRFYRRAILDDHIAEKVYRLAETPETYETHLEALINNFARRNAYVRDFAESIVLTFSSGFHKDIGIKIKRKESTRIHTVKIGEKWGLIDDNGNEITPIQYDNAVFFDEDLAIVAINDKWGFIDTNGDEIIPIKYDEVWYFYNGLARVKLNGKWGFSDKTGKEVIPIKYEYTLSFSEGVAGVKLNEKWGFINNKGKEVIPIKYEDTLSFSEGVAGVKLNEKWGFINNKGKEVIPFIYDDVQNFSEGLALVKINNSRMFIDKTGEVTAYINYKDTNILIPDIDTLSFDDGLARVTSENGMYGFIDKTGNLVIPFKYFYAWKFKEGLAAVQGIRGWGFINKKGEKITPFNYNMVLGFFEGFSSVIKKEIWSKNEKWGIIDKAGREIIPCKYNEAHYGDNMIVASLNWKYGFLDMNGKEVIPFKYDNAKSFRDGLAKVELNGEEFYINKKGERVYPKKD